MKVLQIILLSLMDSLRNNRKMFIVVYVQTSVGLRYTLLYA